MKQLSRLVTVAGQMLVLTLLMFLLANIVAFIFLKVDSKVESMRASHRPSNDWWVRQRPDWWAGYYADANDSRVRWTPYSYWISTPLGGKYIHIDGDGLRHTSHNGLTSSASTKRLFRVFMFGGSTMLGTGASDDYTIPSALVRDLAQRGIGGVEIINFGQGGYVSTQEIILLLAQLSRGNRPDLVIFYDGCNDTFSAFQNGEAGVTENERNRAREFNVLNTALPEARRQLFWFTAQTFARRLYIVRMTIICLRKLGIPLKDFADDGGGIWSWERFKPGHPGLAKSTVDTYLQNIHFIAEVGRRMGFATLFYWQPTLYSKAGVAPGEERFLHLVQIGDAEVAEPLPKETSSFFREVNRQIHSAAKRPPYQADRLEFLDDALPAKKACYIDFMHVIGDCNEIIAQRMAPDIARIVNESRRTEKAAQ
jgi:lysophospholipase L1-like esterase